MIKNFTYGSDPEYFIKNEATGMIVSSIPIVEGTKESPEELGYGFKILKDNILVEGNIPPATDMAGFITNMRALRMKIDEYIKNKYPMLGLCHEDCLDVAPQFLSHPEALQFGCSPYLNAWDDEDHRANDLSSETFRTAGFHVHIGYDIEPDVLWSKDTLNQMIARAFDMFVVLPSCLVNVDKRRFENYGGLGQYRTTPYGLECRSLGAYFVADKFLPWVIEQTFKALLFCQSEENIYKLMYMKKPNAGFKSTIFAYDSGIYNDLEISFREQCIPSKILVNV
jgi:hypothetical protein